MGVYTGVFTFNRDYGNISLEPFISFRVIYYDKL